MSWKDNLPRVYSENLGAVSLTDTADSIGLDLYVSVNSLRDFLNPAITNEAGLNFIAERILDLTSWYWDDNWSVTWKRLVIQNYSKLVRERGNKSLIPFLFNLFGLNVVIVGTGWIINTSKFPMTLGAKWDELVLKVPMSYQGFTPEYKMIQSINKWFVPDLVTLVIQYV